MRGRASVTSAPDRLRETLARREAWRREGRVVVFTNGCFDLLHAGHIRLLESARAEGDALVVGLNSDDSVRRLKGPRRPVLPQDERAEALLALETVDDVIVYDDDTPLRAIVALRPDVLVKGADWPLDRIVGRAEVESWGGRVARVDLVPGRSTTTIIERATRPASRE